MISTLHSLSKVVRVSLLGHIFRLRCIGHGRQGDVVSWNVLVDFLGLLGHDATDQEAATRAAACKPCPAADFLAGVAGDSSHVPRVDDAGAEANHQGQSQAAIFKPTLGPVLAPGFSGFGQSDQPVQSFLVGLSDFRETGEELVRVRAAVGKALGRLDVYLVISLARGGRQLGLGILRLLLCAGSFFLHLWLGFFFCHVVRSSSARARARFASHVELCWPTVRCEVE
eukprot:scaffold109_cov368-Pavlova_lutheri.AAC.14